ncbi:hypothetical protein VA249_32610 [Vibrio alfacsensis]|nr:hypothetical protein VA249_32610 [Vibrio alfacsensis]
MIKPNQHLVIRYDRVAWSEIDQLEQADLGFIIHLGKQRQYVSKSCLNKEVIAVMVKQHAALKAN